MKDKQFLCYKRYARLFTCFHVDVTYKHTIQEKIQENTTCCLGLGYNWVWCFVGYYCLFVGCLFFFFLKQAKNPSLGSE